MKRLIGLSMLALLMVAGCGGGGSTENAATQWASQYIGKIADQDTFGLAALVSNSYLNSCQNKTQLVNEFQTVFDNATAISVSFEIRSSSVNGSAGTAQVTGDLAINATGDGGYSFSVSGVRTFQLVREAGVWRYIGNQTCP